jgi:Leucine-rich repeat (LRR) protein
MSLFLLCVFMGVCGTMIQDQFDVFDFSDNDILKLDNFPLLKRLTSVLVSNNKISVIADGLGAYLPKLETLVLSNNKLSQFAELNALAGALIFPPQHHQQLISTLFTPIVVKINKFATLQYLVYHSLADWPDLFNFFLCAQICLRCVGCRCWATPSLASATIAST